MNARSLLVMASLLVVASVAHAQGAPAAPHDAHASHADAWTPAPAHTPDAEMSDDDFDGPDDLAWLSGDDDDEGGPADGPGERHVIVRRMIGDGGMESMGPGGMRRPGMGAMGGRGAMMMMRLHQLDLTDAQKDRMHAIHDTHARKAIQMRADLALARLDLQKAMRGDPPQASSVYSAIDRVHRQMAEMQKDRFAAHLEMRGVLTPDQVKKLHQPMQGMGEMRMKRGSDSD